MNRQDTIDVIVECPGGHKLRIYIRPKGQLSEIDKEINFLYTAPKESDSLMKMRLGDEEFKPDGIRTLKYPLKQVPRNLDKYDVRVV